MAFPSPLMIASVLPIEDAYLLRASYPFQRKDTTKDHTQLALTDNDNANDCCLYLQKMIIMISGYSQLNNIKMELK